MIDASHAKPTAPQIIPVKCPPCDKIMRLSSARFDRIRVRIAITNRFDPVSIRALVDISDN